MTDIHKYIDLYKFSVLQVQQLKNKLTISNKANAELEVKLSRLTKDDNVKQKLYKYECLKQYYLSLGGPYEDDTIAGITQAEFYSKYHIWKNHRLTVAHPPVRQSDLDAESVSGILSEV